jgi:threonine/homoserine/homoserine lactone efflux protein
MEALLAFIIAYIFSFIGTLPPGTINLSIIQLGLEHRIGVAWRMAFAAALIEYPYAWLAVKFEDLITSSPVVTENFQLIAAAVMLTLGILNLISASKPTSMSTRFNASGFRRGLILGILNPLALPYWVAMTAYIKSLGWTDLSTTLELHAYLLGVSLGGFTILVLFAHLAKKVMVYFQHNTVIKKIPGITLIVLGVYSLIRYIMNL